ncbi:DUF262 domain-containing protein [Roseateles sp. L2-2]|uniref:DUF262 domain-containing protein n=1 Tax=Roseateles sp. L2-2 TaxID=3422597 RepID=UPI003D35B51B
MKNDILNEVAAEEYQEELDRARLKVAQQLSELSQSEVVPHGYGSFLGSFEPDEVDFSSGAWVLKVLHVQAWLGLNGTLKLGDPKEQGCKACAAEVFSQLGDLDSLISEEFGFPTPTLKGAEVFGARLDIAQRLQQVFTESHEINPLQKATKDWEAAWEEAALDVDEVGGQIQANSKTWPLNQFSYYAKKNQLNLTPSYQRGDVWPTSDAQKLIESVLRGIPLPSIILLTPKPKGKKEAAGYEVVDGKQRLTSILRFTGQHPEAIRHVTEMDKKYPGHGLLTLFRNDYRKFRTVWKRVVGVSLTEKLESQYYFPFPIRSQARALDESMWGRYYCEIHDERVAVGANSESVQEIFEQTSQYLVPIIEYIEATPRQIQEVFNLYNKQGKHLNAEEIRNALFHEVDLVRLLLVAAGDNRDLKLADFLDQESRARLPGVSKTLDGYRFGTSRYKRTKVLSWFLSLLFEPAEKNGELTVRSTAKQIDGLFAKIRDVDNHLLAKKKTLDLLVLDLSKALTAHSSASCWNEAFKDNNNGEKWLELQLVASLVAVFLLAQVVDDVESLLDTRNEEIYDFTKKCPRPRKAQNKTQWAFIGKAALGIVEAAGVPLPDIESALIARYAQSCVPTLVAAAKNPVD